VTSLRVATDIGGTFTDLVYVDETSGAVGFAKASTTPADPARGVLDAIAAGELRLADVVHFVHGTTIVINALTERRGARTALVTTRGFRDVLEIARGNRPDMYNLVSRKPPPFVRRRHRFEVRERVDRHGAVLVPLDLAELDEIAAACERERIEAIAVCFLHSYAHPQHERQARDELAARLPGLPITISSDITREWREYERTSTAVLNGYVQPAVDRYLGGLGRRLADAGLESVVHVMQSNAGTTSVASARARPIYLVESGPAGGIMGAARIGREIGEPNAIFLDIGGTTAKCSLIQDGEAKTTTQYRIEWRPDYAGYPVLVPVVDVVEIGAGGGSIAWVDRGGALRVGPRSAGAEPGPACYGRGGTELTVTDAKLLAGVLNPEYILGGRLEVFPELARAAAERFGAAIGSSAEAVANGVIRLVNANMINALKLVSVGRGHDPRDFVLIAGGGGGAMHAAALGEELQVKRVLVPPFCGVLSAWGMLVTDPRTDVIQTSIMRTSATSAGEVAAIFAGLEAEASARLREQGIDASLVEHVRAVDMRYAGQEHTVRVAIGPPDELSLESLVQAFHEQHLLLYTFNLPDVESELVTFHVAAHGRPRARVAPAGSLRANGERPAPKARRRVDFDVDGVHETPVYERGELPAGFSASGPVLVEELSSTTLVHPEQRLEVDSFGNLVVHLRDPAKEA
jgi:N-methylhydantoinase A